MKICIPQMLNALSLLSPLMFWRKHKNKIGHTLIHKFVIIHLPISFTYHFLKGLCWHNRISEFVKLVDYACIHSYAILCCACKRHRCRKQHTSILSNIYCIQKVIFSRNEVETIRFTMIRLSSLASAGHCFTSHTTKKKYAIVHGTTCTLLFMIDENLKNYGHCLFHLALGGLYNCIFNIVTDVLSQIPTNNGV